MANKNLRECREFFEAAAEKLRTAEAYLDDGAFSSAGRLYHEAAVLLDQAACAKAAAFGDAS